MKKAETAAPSTTTTKKKSTKGFSEEELAAMKERAKEVTADAGSKSRPKKAKPDGEGDLLAKIAEMPEPDRSMATRIHEIIKATAPELSPKTWYGQPAYAKDDKIVCFFQNSQKFGIRYATLGFNEAAHLDDGNFWPVAYALKELTPTEEAKIKALVKKAVG